MKSRYCIYVLLSVLILLGCAASSGGLKILEPPKENQIMIIGNIIVENINQEFAFDDWGQSIQVLIIGKTLDGVVNQYTVNSDSKGYYCLPNVPQGQYVIKAITLIQPGEKPIKLVNDLTSANSSFYRMRHPERPVVDSVTWLPAPTNDKIVNFNIIWFGLRAASISDLSGKSIGEILQAKSSADLTGKRFYDGGFPYTRETPEQYFKIKFPDSKWWTF
ncbi:hypothetical protein JXQ31_09530 [candidate division KSB1 bacterium]|nr:hypothetical protein [candidate division KSB1 bacterium]